MCVRAVRDRASIWSRHRPGRGSRAMSVHSSRACSIVPDGSKPTTRLESPEGAEHRALVRVVQLAGGFHLLVGRDLDERERLFGIIVNAGKWSLALVIVLGLVGGFFVSRRVLSRIDAMTGTAQTIMAGDLSGRLPVP